MSRKPEDVAAASDSDAPEELTQTSARSSIQEAKRLQQEAIRFLFTKRKEERRVRDKRNKEQAAVRVAKPKDVKVTFSKERKKENVVEVQSSEAEDVTEQQEKTPAVPKGFAILPKPGTITEAEREQMRRFASFRLTSSAPRIPVSLSFKRHLNATKLVSVGTRSTKTRK